MSATAGDLVRLLPPPCQVPAAPLLHDGADVPAGADLSAHRATVIKWRAAALLIRHIGGVDELCVLPTSALMLARLRGNAVLPRRSF